MYRYEERECLTTQIGSLPFSDADRAVEYSLEHEIPFLPELTSRGDAMMRYIETPGSLSCLRAFKRNRFDTVKVQCVGPATLVQSGKTADDAVSRAYAHIDAVLDGLVADEVLLFLDEPALGYVGFDYLRLWEPLFESFPVIPGVHVCGNMQWDELMASGIAVVSFDASRYDITKYYEDRGGVAISWGIESLEDIADYRPGDLITLPCGMPHKAYSEEDAVQRLDLLQTAAEWVRRSPGSMKDEAPLSIESE